MADHLCPICKEPGKRGSGVRFRCGAGHSWDEPLCDAPPLPEVTLLDSDASRVATEQYVAGVANGAKAERERILGNLIRINETATWLDDFEREIGALITELGGDRA